MPWEAYYTLHLSFPSPVSSSDFNDCRHIPHHWNVEATDMMVMSLDNNKHKSCGSNTAKTYKSVRSLRYCWNVYMRELSFLGSFPQTSAHIRAGGTTKPAAWNAHTHMHRYISTGTCLCTAILLAQSTTTPLNVCHTVLCIFISHQIYFMPLHTTRDFLQSISSFTVKERVFHGSITYCGNCYTAVFWNQWSPGFISPITFFLPSITLSRPYDGRKNKKSPRHQAYLQICMHSNSYPELPKLRITQFWIKGERKIIHKKPLQFQLMSFSSHADS